MREKPVACPASATRDGRPQLLSGAVVLEGNESPPSSAHLLRWGLASGRFRRTVVELQVNISRDPAATPREGTGKREDRGGRPPWRSALPRAGLQSRPARMP